MKHKWTKWVVIVTLATVLVSSTPSQAAIQPQTQSKVEIEVSTEWDHTDVFAVESESGVRRLVYSAAPGAVSADLVALSPNERYVALVETISNSETDLSKIVLIDLESDTPGDLVLPHHGGMPTNPLWSPDSARLAYVWSKPSEGTVELWVVEIATGQRQQLATGGTFWPVLIHGKADSVAWESDGQAIQFMDERDGQIYRVTLNEYLLEKIMDKDRVVPALSGYWQTGQIHPLSPTYTGMVKPLAVRDYDDTCFNGYTGLYPDYGGCVLTGGHPAVDMAWGATRIGCGTPVVAVCNGPIIKAVTYPLAPGVGACDASTETVWPRHLGWHVVLRCDTPNATLNGTVYGGRIYVVYAHLSSIEPGLGYGVWVDKGEKLGEVGSTGNSGGPHLHLQMERDNQSTHPSYWTDEDQILKYTWNPMYFIQAHEGNQPPQKPTLTAPTNGDWIDANSTTLTWQAGSDDGLPNPTPDFWIQVDDNQSFSSPNRDTGWGYTSLSLGVSLNDDWYYWRVNQGDGASSSGWTTPRSFGLDVHAPLNPAYVNSGCTASNNIWQNSCDHPSFTWRGASDGKGSGVAGYEYRWQTQSGVLIEEGGTSGTSFDPSSAVGDGVYALRMRTQDNMGHWSGWSDTFILRYDTTVPTVTLQINNGAETTNQTSVLLNLSADDTGSGVADVCVSNSNSSCSDWQPYANTIPWALPALNRRTLPVYVQVRDHAGNESTVASASIYLDLYPPMPHSDNYRICADVVDIGGAVGLTSTNYSLVSAIGQPWATGAISNTSSEFNEHAGFLSSITGCLPISYVVTSEFTVTQWVVASGGNLRGSASYRLGDTTGQSAASGAGVFTSSSYVLSSGFWANVTGTLPARPPDPPYYPPPTPAPSPTPGPTPTPQPSGFGVSIDDGALYTNDPVVTVRVWAPNVTHLRLSNDGGYSDAGWRAYQVTTTWVISTYSDYVMPCYVYAWFRDAGSSVYGSYSDNIIYDPVAPIGSVELLVAGDGVAIWLEAADDNSGVDQMRVGEETVGTGTAWLPYDGIPWQPYTNTITWVLQSNVVYAQFKDRAGNLSPIYGSDGSIHWLNEHYIYLPLVLRSY